MRLRVQERTALQIFR